MGAGDNDRKIRYNIIYIIILLQNIFYIKWYLILYCEFIFHAPSQIVICWYAL